MIIASAIVVAMVAVMIVSVMRPVPIVLVMYNTTGNRYRGYKS
jgi:hypothetical protein